MSVVDVHAAIREVMIPRHNITDLLIGKGQWIGVRRSRNWFPILFKQLGWNEGVEVGTQRGDYAEVLLQNHPGLHLTCVDPWSSFGKGGKSGHNKNFSIATEKLARYNATILRTTSMRALCKFADGSLDFVYIDGDHTFDFVSSDIIFWSHKVKSGGMICCHDYCQWWEVGVAQAVDSYTFCHGIRPVYVNREGSPTAFWINP